MPSSPNCQSERAAERVSPRWRWRSRPSPWRRRSGRRWRSRRGSAASISRKRRVPTTPGSRLAASAIAPSRITLSQTMTAPGAGQAQRPGEIVGVAALVGVDEDEVERAVEGRQRVGAPGRGCSSTRSARPARAMLARATSAWRRSASRVTSLPPREGRGRARSSNSRRACRSRGCGGRPPSGRGGAGACPASGETSIAGSPAAALAASAAARAGSSPTRSSAR